MGLSENRPESQLEPYAVGADFPLKDFYGDIYKSYDRVNRIFTFGRDVSWRRLAVRECLRDGPVNILDLCTGTGDFILELARQAGTGNIAPRLTGYDFSESMLKEARRKAEFLKSKQQIPSITFTKGDVAGMPFEENSFDAMGITFGIRNLVYENSNAEKHLSEMHRVLRPGGQLIVLESCRPENVIWRSLNNLYLRFILPWLGGILSGNLKAYSYLAKSSRNYYTMEEMGTILEEAGFGIVSGKSLFLGSVMLLVAKKR